MREIKFRYILKHRSLPDDPIEIEIFSIEEIEKDRFEKDTALDLKDVLSRDQYTGLKDKNGKESYHKDICEDEIGNRYVIEEDNNEGKWYLDLNGRKYPFTNLSRWKIIGNTHENPELLEAS